jgi:ornithine decarboxylase
MTVMQKISPARSAQFKKAAVDVVRELEPDVPLICLRPAELKKKARAFLDGFPGDVLYAVKCNPDADVLKHLVEGGITHFDAASMAEIRQVRAVMSDAAIHFMHPIKARSAIRAAYFDYGVRDFVLDSFAELHKILAETKNAADLVLVVRLAMPKGQAVYDLSGKFGAAPQDAAALLKACAKVAAKVGLSFHVGSQCVDPSAYERALDLAGQVIAQSGVALDVLDVGGGFPVAYADVQPPPLAHFLAAISRGVAKLDLPAQCRLWCEPGRALVAEGQSVVVQVQAKKGGALYINDGVYGTLSDAGAAVGLRFPVRVVAQGAARRQGRLRAFEFFGPTCDSCDRMRGPFLLPSDIQVGDWIEIGQVGAYGRVLSTGFNGFDEILRATVDDRPPVEEVGAVLAPLKSVRAA